MKEFVRKHAVAVALGIGLVIGALWLIGLRYATYQSDAVHYHANFAVYINGNREPFDSFAFYEEVQSCGGDAIFNPKTRVHMHEQVNHVVHVHDAAATWGHLFANLGYTLGNDLISTDNETFIEDDTNELTFILNGQETRSIANQTIRSEDVLLINFGDDSGDALQQRYDSIGKDAGEYNGLYDPSACAGGRPLTFGERLKEAVGVF